MNKLVTMREALRDRHLLGDALPGDSWSAWRTLLIAAAGEALTDDERQTFKALTGRDREPGAMIETLLVVGAAAKQKRWLCCRSIWRRCATGPAISAWVSAAWRCSWHRPSGRRVSRIAMPRPSSITCRCSLIENRTANALALKRSIDLETQPASWRFSRGFTSVSIALDECAFLYCSDEAANSDTELLIVLRPSLSTTNGPMLLTSSPSNMEGVVYRLWKRHHGAQGDPRCLVVQADSRTLNPCLRADVVSRAYEEDAVAAEAEFGGQFRQPITAYLDRAVVEKAIDTGVTGRTKLPGVQYRAHVDVAGGTGSDSFCAAIGHNMHDAGRDIVVVDAAAAVGSQRRDRRFLCGRMADHRVCQARHPLPHRVADDERALSAHAAAMDGGPGVDARSSARRRSALQPAPQARPRRQGNHHASEECP